MSYRSFLIASATALVAAGSASAQTAPVAKPMPSVAAPVPVKYEPWGVDIRSRDLSVKPGDDFQLYAGGRWFATAQIPADRPMVGTGLMVYERNQGYLDKLIQNAAPDSAYGILYRDFMDTAAVDRIGDAPLREEVARLMALPDKAAFTRYMAQTSDRFGSTVAAFGVSGDLSDPTMNVVWLGTSGIGMPNKDFYLAERFAPQRAAYTAYLTRTLTMLGIAEPAAGADKIFAFERSLAEKRLSPAEMRDFTKLNNPMTLDQLKAFAPGLDWPVLLEGAKLSTPTKIIVPDKNAIRDTAAIYAETPLETLKLWEAVKVAGQATPFLPAKWADSQFEYAKAVSGIKAQLPREKRAIGLVDGQLGQLIGQDYVKAHFTAEAKTKMLALVGNLKAAMGDRIRSNTWMSAPTKAAALEKLAKMDVMVGYPDQWRDYSALKLVPGDLLGNMQRLNQFNYAYTISDAGKPVDFKRWAMNPQTLDAYNGLSQNKIVFPAGILQAPYFSAQNDDAVNYGAIGAVIGHEITHGFDDQGRTFDANGTLRDWWTPEDAKRFEERAKVVGDQYAQFEVAPGVAVNPKLTMGENIADIAGLQIALDAYHKSLGGKKAPVIDGLTGDQRFFLSFAQVWRAKVAPDTLKAMVASDPHSPARFRTNGPVRNIDAWYTAFNVKPGDAMYLPPEKRARIW